MTDDETANVLRYGIGVPADEGAPVWQRIRYVWRCATAKRRGSGPPEIDRPRALVAIVEVGLRQYVVFREFALGESERDGAIDAATGLAHALSFADDPWREAARQGLVDDHGSLLLRTSEKTEAERRRCAELGLVRA